MPRDPKIRRAVPCAPAASTIARASRRKSSSPRATKDGPLGMVARGEVGGLRRHAERRMWEARRSQRASRESQGPYKDVHGASRCKSIAVCKSLMNGRPVTGAGAGARPVGEVDVFARRGAQATAQVQVFTRRASGLVRVMSPYSAFAYNVLNIGVIFPWVYITTLSVFPNANVWVGIIVTGLFTGFLAVVYAGLASAMPRTGGDYVFQSRTLKPWLGFAIVSTMIITFFLQWQALGGWLVAILGLSPMFLGLGLTMGNQMFIDWGVWFATPMGAMITTMVTSTIAAAVLIKSFRWFVKIQWVMWYGFLQSLRNQMFINLGGGLVSMVMMAVLAFAMIQTVGQNWLSGAAAASFVPGLPMISPWFSNLAMMLTDNPIILFLMIVGVLLNALQVVFNVIIGWTRVAVAMSIDGALPKVVSHVSPRTHTPVYAHVIFLILGGYLYAFIYNMVPGYLTYTLAVTAVATVMYIGTAIGGAIFPRTRREVYRTSPIAKYKIGPIPVITICGAIAAAFSAAMLYLYIVEPFLGIANLSAGFDGVKSLLIMLAIFVGWSVYYFVRRAYLRSVGINLDLAYKEIPPI